MKRIAFLIADMGNGGGTERVTAQIGNGLANNGYEVSIISCKNGLSTIFPLDSKIRLFSLHGEKTSQALLRRFKNYRALWSLVKREKFDVIIGVDVGLYLYILPLRMLDKSCKHIAWEHFHCHYTPNLIHGLSRFFAARFADCVITLSDRDLENYKARYKRIRRIERLYNPLALDYHGVSDMSQKAVIAAGRLEEQKGFDRLIMAWSKLENDFTEWTCDIYGEGSLRPRLERMISEYGLRRIFLRGYQTNIDAEYQRHSIFVLTSHFEGFGLVLIEAQAKGLPCVSFDCHEGPSEIISDGINGFLVPEGDVEGLTEKLGELMKDKTLRESFSKNSRKDLERFHPDTVTKNWLEFLESL